MRARLQAKYLNVNDSNPGWKPITFGSFTGVGGLVKVSLQLEGIPDGSLVCPVNPLVIFESHHIIRFTLEPTVQGQPVCYTSLCIAHGAWLTHLYPDRWDNTYYVVKYDGSVKEYPQFKL